MGRCCCFSSTYLFIYGLCLTIAVVDLILGIIGVINSGRFLADLEKDGTVKQKEIEVQFPSYIAVIICTVIQVASWLQIILSFVLIHGIRKKSNTLMNVWMISKVISFLLNVIALITIYSYKIPFESLPFLPPLISQLNLIWCKCIYFIQLLKTENKMKAQVLAIATFQNNQIQIRNNEIQMKQFAQNTTLYVQQMIEDLKDLNKSHMEAEILTKSNVQSNQIQNNGCNNLPENIP